MADELGATPTWVEAQISNLRKAGLIKIAKRPPKKKVLQTLKEIASIQDKNNTSFVNTADPEKKTETGKRSQIKKSKTLIGVPEGWRRGSIVAKIERFTDLDDLAWYSRRLLREIQDEALAEYIEKRGDQLLKAREERQKTDLLMLKH